MSTSLLLSLSILYIPSTPINTSLNDIIFKWYSYATVTLKVRPLTWAINGVRTVHLLRRSSIQDNKSEIKQIKRKQHQNTHTHTHLQWCPDRLPLFILVRNSVVHSPSPVIRITILAYRHTLASAYARVGHRWRAYAVDDVPTTSNAN